MRILLVAATEMEIMPFLKTNNSIDILICGVGIPATIYHLTKKLLNEEYEFIIQAGIAGTFSKQIKKGEVVIVEQDVFADIGVEEKKKFKTLFDLGFANEKEFPFKNGWLVNTSDIFSSMQIKKVNAVTVNKISDRKKQTRQLKQIFNAAIESMEGAAFHYVCLQQKIPFLQLRCISNKVGERDKTLWKIKESIENLNTELIKLVDLINSK